MFFMVEKPKKKTNRQLSEYKRPHRFSDVELLEILDGGIAKANAFEGSIGPCQAEFQGARCWNPSFQSV